MRDCGLCEQQLQDGYLCPLCTKNTLVRLECMPELHKGLAAFLEPGRRSDGQASRAGRTGPSLPVAEDVLNLRGPGGMVGLLEDWRSAMQADRGWKEPVAAGLLEERIVHAARGLAMNMEWISSSWPLAGAFAEEIRDLVRDVRSIIDPRDPRDRGMRLGYCPAVDESGNVCGAVVRYQTGAKAAVCSWCGCAFPPAVWADLKVLMDHDQADRQSDDPQPVGASVDTS